MTQGTALDHLRQRSGLDVVGAFSFGESAEQADRLLAFVEAGTKRATAGSVAHLPPDEPFPAAGQHWGLLDGRGDPRFVVETQEVRVGRLDSVDAAFAWDEGEFDRTREGWLDDHRAYVTGLGIADPDAAEMTFERFRVVWPAADRPSWLLPGVRVLRWDERAWAVEAVAQRRGTTIVPTSMGDLDLAGLPMLVHEAAAGRLGLLAFRPRPGVATQVAAVDVLGGGDATARALLDGVAVLARTCGWEEVWADGDELGPLLVRHGYEPRGPGGRVAAQASMLSA